MKEPVWIEPETLLTLHGRSIALHGGPDGVRDLGLLHAALARPRNRFLYDETVDLAALAALYALAMTADHPFVDGNKRASFIAMALFLRRNGDRLIAGQVQATAKILDLAAGRLSESDLAAWIRSNIIPG